MSENEFNAAAVVEGSFSDIAPRLDALDAEQLAAVRQVEEAGKNRTNVTNAIDRAVVALEKDNDPEPEAPVESGFVRLYAPDNCEGCSHDGKSYPCEDGTVTVPHAAVAALEPHGFSTTKPGK